MRDDIKKLKLFSRRVVVLAGIKLILFTTILARYYYLQVVKSDRYSIMSDKNHIKLIALVAPRGRVTDRKDEEIAGSTTHFRLSINPLDVGKAKFIITKVEGVIARSLGINDEVLRRKLLKRNKNDPLILEENVSWHDMAKIIENNHLVKSVEIIEGISRSYRNGEAFAHILGYIGIPTQQEITDMKLPKFSDLRIGKSGLEKVFDQQLRGEAGYRKVEIDVRGRFVREIAQQAYIEGEGLQLTIDAQLQEFVHELLISRNVEGAVIVMNAKTGGILALDSTPSFDPNQFVDGVSQEYWNSITSNVNNPLINNAISSPYPPGSTFKPITAIAGLCTGIDPEKQVFCSGSYRLGSRSFRCWKETGHGYVNMKEAIAQSCNPYFYTISQQIGINKIAETARMLGFDSKTGIELPYEHKGLIPDTSWKKLKLKSNWYPGDTINASIGQGYVLATPLQIATATARIASGRLIHPTLLIKNENAAISKTLESISAEHLAVIREGMFMCANHPSGVVFKHQMSIGDFKIAGKTGTAQVADMKFKNKGKQFKHHALFTSFAPADAPEYVVSVIVEHGEGGAKAAAPIAKEIYIKLCKHC